jgi:hypothetical protein
MPTAEHRPSVRGMAWIEGGDFLMGSEALNPEEGSVRRAEVDGFWIDEHVTSADFSPAPVRARCSPGHIADGRSATRFDTSRRMGSWPSALSAVGRERQLVASPGPQTQATSRDRLQ